MEMEVLGIFLVDIFTLRQRWLKEKAQLEEQPTALNDGRKLEEKLSGMMTCGIWTGRDASLVRTAFVMNTKPNWKLIELC